MEGPGRSRSLSGESSRRLGEADRRPLRLLLGLLSSACNTCLFRFTSMSVPSDKLFLSFLHPAQTSSESIPPPVLTVTRKQMTDFDAVLFRQRTWSVFVSVVVNKRARHRNILVAVRLG